MQAPMPVPHAAVPAVASSPASPPPAHGRTNRTVGPQDPAAYRIAPPRTPGGEHLRQSGNPGVPRSSAAPEPDLTIFSRYACDRQFRLPLDPRAELQAHRQHVKSSAVLSRPMPRIPGPQGRTAMSDQSRSFPDRPSLRYLKLEAHRRLAAGEFARLHEAQLAIAREHGLSSWTALKRLVAGQPDPEGPAVEQLRWVVSRYAQAGQPDWRPP